MNAPRLEELLIAWEENSLTAEALAELKHLLATEPQARRRLVEAGVSQSVAESRVQAWKALEPVGQMPSGDVRRKPSGFSWLSWRPLAAAAAGIVFGMLCTSVAFGYLMPALSRSRQIWTESFESGVARTKPGLPKEAGAWCGDVAEVVAANEQMPAKSGSKMLRFVSATYPGENSPHSVWGDVYRLVDVRGMVDGDSAVARLTAHFAQAAPSSSEAYRCSVAVIALDEMPSAHTLTEIRSAGAASSTRTMALPADSQWHALATDVAVSKQTQFLFVHLAVFLKSPQVAEGVLEFRAHFLDDVKIDLHYPAQH